MYLTDPEKPMAINLHQNCRARLIEVIAGSLPKINVTKGMFLQRASLIGTLSKADKVIPETGDLRKQLVSYIDEHPVFEFVGEMISLELVRRDKYVSDETLVPLTEIEGFEDPEAKALSLVEQLESLPWNYTLSMELPSKVDTFSHELLKGFAITDRIRIASSKGDLDVDYPMQSYDDDLSPLANTLVKLGGLLGGSIHEWNEEKAYIQIDVEGFLGQFGSTTPARRAIEMLRSIYGLAMAQLMLVVNYTPRLGLVLGGGIPKSGVFVHQHTSDGNEFHSNFEVDDLYGPTISDLELHHFFDDKDKDMKAQLVKHVMEKIGDVISSGEKGAKIVLAAQWLFDSYAAQDPLLSFVQTMVVLEILLGEEEGKDEIGLGELMRNRCAYLIASSHQERAEVLKDFQRIYKVRSQIVHRGKSRLTKEERQLFNTLRWMCLRVIHEEQKLLKADIAEQ